MADPVWKSYGSYSGPVIAGKTTIPVPSSKLCMARWHWLTVKVETGATYGTVVMYDGTGVTAGPDQFILVYPKELGSEDFAPGDDQGPLGKLVARLCDLRAPSIVPKIEALKIAFAKNNWMLHPTGELRFLKDGVAKLSGKTVSVKAGGLVFGNTIRDVVTPVGGKVPRVGPHWHQAVMWCRLFAELFGDPAGFSVQDTFGAEKMTSAFKLPRVKTAGGTTSIEKAVFAGADVLLLSSEKTGQELDLAMGLWYSNSVNAPAIAIDVLQRALVGGVNASFPARLIRELATRKYGKWHFTEPNGRYQRSRRFALGSKLWPRGLFEGASAIMPLKF